MVNACSPPAPNRHLGPLTLLRDGGFLRVWMTGGLIGTMRWLEILMIAVYTLEVTGSALAVALMMLARALPMFLFGSITGVIAERVNRRHIMIVVLFSACVVSAGLPNRVMPNGTGKPAPAWGRH